MPLEVFVRKVCAVDSVVGVQKSAYSDWRARGNVSQGSVIDYKGCYLAAVTKVGAARISPHLGPGRRPMNGHAADTRKKIGDDAILLGNFDPYGTFCSMEAPDVEGVIRGCIDAGVDAVWPGCDLWPEVKKENVEMWVKTVREYGKRPTPAVGRV